MIKRLLVVLTTTLLATVTIHAQHYDISRHEADSMLALLPKTKEAARIELLFNLAQFHIFKAGEHKVDLDSGQLYIDQANALIKSLPSSDAVGYGLVNESYLLREKGQREAGKKRAEKAVALLKNSQRRNYLGRALYEQSMYIGISDSSQVLEKTSLVEQAVAAFEQGGDTLRTARSLEMLGDLYMLREERDKSVKVLLQAMALFDSIGYRKLQNVNMLLGTTYRAMDYYGLSLHYHLKALRAAEQEHDSSTMYRHILNQLGMLYTSIGQLDRAAPYFRNALAVAQKLGDTTSIGYVTSNTADIYNENRQPAAALEILQQFPANRLTNEWPVASYGYYRASLMAHVQLKQLDKAQVDCNKLLDLVKGDRVPPILQGGLYRVVAIYYVNNGQAGKARYYLNRSDSLQRQLCSNCDPSRNMAVRYKIDSARQDYRAAFYSLNRYRNVSDSIYGVTKLRQMAVLTVEYEVAQKEDSIKLKNKNILNLQLTNDLQKADLRQASLLTYITIAGIIIAAIIIFLLYRQYRNKQRSNAIISQKNEQLEGLVIEKEWLLKEIHHRVKNNFQTVMSLLGTQTAYLKNDVAVSAINDSQQRIQAMLLIHQRLYKSNNLSSVRIQEYIYELVDSLSDSYNNSQVRFQLQVAPVEFDLAHCIPLGLILNEAITNAFKYAFPDKREGVITITLASSANNRYHLIIQDNGVGLPPDFNMQQSDSMGINLMRGLVHEIGGSFTLSGNDGTRIEISFTYDPVPTMADHAAYA